MESSVLRELDLEMLIVLCALKFGKGMLSVKRAASFETSIGYRRYFVTIDITEDFDIVACFNSIRTWKYYVSEDGMLHNPKEFLICCLTDSDFLWNKET